MGWGRLSWLWNARGRSRNGCEEASLMGTGCIVDPDIRPRGIEKRTKKEQQVGLIEVLRLVVCYALIVWYCCPPTKACGDKALFKIDIIAPYEVNC